MPARADLRNHHNLAYLHQRLDNPNLRIISLVCNDCARLGVLQQHVCAFRVTGLSGREVKTRRIAQRIDRCIDFRHQAATAAPNRLAWFRLIF